MNFKDGIKLFVVDNLQKLLKKIKHLIIIHHPSNRKLPTIDDIINAGGDLPKAILKSITKGKETERFSVGDVEFIPSTVGITINPDSTITLKIQQQQSVIDYFKNSTGNTQVMTHKHMLHLTI